MINFNSNVFGKSTQERFGKNAIQAKREKREQKIDNPFEGVSNTYSGSNELKTKTINSVEALSPKYIEGGQNMNRSEKIIPETKNTYKIKEKNTSDLSDGLKDEKAKIFEAEEEPKEEEEEEEEETVHKKMIRLAKLPRDEDMRNLQVKDEEEDLKNEENEKNEDLKISENEDFKKGDIGRIAKENLEIMAKVFTEKIPEIGKNIAEGITNVPVGITNEIIKSQNEKYNTDMNMVRNPFEVQRGEKEHKKGLVERTMDNIEEGKQFAIEAINSRNRGEQTNKETAFQVAAGVAKPIIDTIGDASMSAISTLTPKEQKDFATEKLQNLMDTKGGEYVKNMLDTYQKDMETLKEIDPKKYREFQSIFTFLEGAGELVGAKKGQEVMTKGLEQVAKETLQNPIIDGKILGKEKGENIFSSITDNLKEKGENISNGLNNLKNQLNPVAVEANPNTPNNMPISPEQKLDTSKQIQKVEAKTEGEIVDRNPKKPEFNEDDSLKLDSINLHDYKKGNKTQFLPAKQIRYINSDDEIKAFEGLQKLVNRTSTVEKLSSVGEEFGDAGEVVLTKNCYKKIVAEHDKLKNMNQENMVITANDWDLAYKNVDGNLGEIVLLKKMPHGHYLCIPAKLENGKYFVQSYYEIFSKDIAANYAGRGTLVERKK